MDVGFGSINRVVFVCEATENSVFLLSFIFQPTQSSLVLSFTLSALLSCFFSHPVLVSWFYLSIFAMS